MGKRCNIESKNPQWKGDRVSYKGLHQWARRHVPKPTACPDCGENAPLEICNESGRYLRDIADWKWRCRRCHMKSDGRLDRLKKMAAAANRKRHANKTLC
jgi:hypothetical protein